MNQEFEAYIKIIAPSGIPPFLDEYARAPEMVRLRGIGLFCGTDYSKLYNHRYFYSRYEHSLIAALIIWRFTSEKAQALSGLFHDIATPVFSHSVDFMNGDTLNQLSTEELTGAIIKNSDYIQQLLCLDGIRLCEVDDYHMYPIADNDTPKLSADRLEYTLSTMLVWHGKWTLADVSQIINDLTVYDNELELPEIGFTTLSTAENFVRGACTNGLAFQKNDNTLSLNLLGDILKMALSNGELKTDELYSLTENQAIERLCGSREARIRNAWRNYSELHTVYGNDTMPEVKYAVNVEVKKRYINPLVKHNGVVQRTAAASVRAKTEIDSLLSYRDKPFAYADFSV